MARSRARPRSCIFEEAKRDLYVNYEAETYTQLYINYLKSQAAYESMQPEMKSQYQEKYGDERRPLVNTLNTFNCR